VGSTLAQNGLGATEKSAEKRILFRKKKTQLKGKGKENFDGETVLFETWKFQQVEK